MELPKGFDTSAVRPAPLTMQIVSCPDDDVSTPARYARFKRLIDLGLSTLFLCVSAPVLAIIALLVALDGGPVLYGHERIGRWNRSFKCLKFRTMRVNSDDVLSELLSRNAEARREWACTRKLRSDPRITRLGKILRATSLDELPQLINVLLGDMSLVGPRPVVADELESYYFGECRSAYLSVRPGITGLWQVSGRSNTTFDQRVLLDLHYVRSACLELDINIIARTFVAVLGRRGAV